MIHKTIEISVPDHYTTAEAQRALEIVQVALHTKLSCKGPRGPISREHGNESLEDSMYNTGARLDLRYLAKDGRTLANHITVRPDVPRVGVPPADSSSLGEIVGTIENIIGDSSPHHEKGQVYRFACSVN